MTYILIIHSLYEHNTGNNGKKGKNTYKSILILTLLSYESNEFFTSSNILPALLAFKFLHIIPFGVDQFACKVLLSVCISKCYTSQLLCKYKAYYFY